MVKNDAKVYNSKILSLEKMNENFTELELNYTLDFRDLIELKMYIASQNKKINKQRIINRFVIVLICIIFAGIYMYRGDNVASTYFLLMGSVCFVLYPWYLNWLYRRTYGRQISSTELPIHVWFKMDETHVVTLSKGITTTILLGDVAEIVELDNYFYLKKSLNEWIVIPKTELNNEENVRAFLISAALVNSIRYSEKKGFKWK